MTISQLPTKIFLCKNNCILIFLPILFKKTHIKKQRIAKILRFLIAIANQNFKLKTLTAFL